VQSRSKLFDYRIADYALLNRVEKCMFHEILDHASCYVLVSNLWYRALAKRRRRERDEESSAATTRASTHNDKG
jgi:hypothetical protein